MDENLPGYTPADDREHRTDFVKRAFCISLKRRPNRWQAFCDRVVAQEWPFCDIEWVEAVDGRRHQPESWWGHQGHGAWGCYRSHLKIMEFCLAEGIEPALIMEDDAYPVRDFSQRVTTFLDRVPSDWQCIYLGGQHIWEGRPVEITEGVLSPWNVNRTHAYIWNLAGMEIAHRHLTDTEAWQCEPSYHIDHWLGLLHKRRELITYTPRWWLMGQMENQSDIAGRGFKDRKWQEPNIRSESHERQPLVAVIGLHRSGSSCLAGVLHHLGIWFGPEDQMDGYEPLSCEAAALSRACENSMPFPTMEIRSEKQLRRRMETWVRTVKVAAMAQGTLAGIKYPHLCALGQFVDNASPLLRVIHINRPLDESIASLIRRSSSNPGAWHAVAPEQCRRVQTFLHDRKHEWLSRREHLTVEYANLLDSPEKEVDRLIGYLELTVTPEQRQAAIAHVRRPDSS